MNIVAIDPGVSGGIARLDEKGPRAFKMPDTEADLADLLREIIDDDTFAYLEKVHAMPAERYDKKKDKVIKQGISSTWKFGQNYGGLKMALALLKVPYEEVPPGVWQKAVGIAPIKGESQVDHKNRLKARAQELFPSLKITHAIADALLIGTDGWKKTHGLPYRF